MLLELQLAIEDNALQYGKQVTRESTRSPLPIRSAEAIVASDHLITRSLAHATVDSSCSSVQMQSNKASQFGDQAVTRGLAQAALKQAEQVSLELASIRQQMTLAGFVATSESSGAMAVRRVIHGFRCPSALFIRSGLGTFSRPHCA